MLSFFITNKRKKYLILKLIAVKFSLNYQTMRCTGEQIGANKSWSVTSPVLQTLMKLIIDSV